MSHHLIPSLKVIMWDPVGPPFSDSILRGSTIFNAFYGTVQKAFYEVRRLLQGSARFCEALPGCVVPTQPMLRVRFNEDSMKPNKSREVGHKFAKVKCAKKIRLGRLGCEMDVRIERIAHGPHGQPSECDNLIFTSRPKNYLICMHPNCKNRSCQCSVSTPRLRVKTPDCAEQTTNLWIAMQATMFSYKFLSLRWTAMSMVWCHRSVMHLPHALAPY